MAVKLEQLAQNFYDHPVLFSVYDFCKRWFEMSCEIVSISFKRLNVLLKLTWKAILVLSHHPLLFSSNE